MAPAPSLSPEADRRVRIAALKRARDLAGGVSYLARRIGIGADTLDEMLHGTEDIVSWVFLRAIDFIQDAEAANAVPPGFPPDWEASIIYDDARP
jgi:hypothetical protein